MTETRARYEVDRRPGVLPRGTLKRYTDPEYTPPTPADVRTLKAISGLTGRELSELAGMDDHRTWRRWSQDEDQAGHRRIPYSAWRLLVLELGLVSHQEVGATRVAE